MIVLVSDNGASGEGGPNGSSTRTSSSTASPTTSSTNLAMIDELGSPKTYNHYPNGWAMAFNTPFKMWKRYEFNGGSCDPCIISWPKGIKARGEIRHQYHHAIDIVPTILDCLGVEPPGDDQGPRAEQLRRDQHALQLRPGDDPDGAVDAVLLDARLAGDLARGLEGRQHAPDDRGLEPLQRRHVGAVQRRDRPRGAPRPRRRAPGEAARAHQPLVLRGRRQRSLPAR